MTSLEHLFSLPVSDVRKRYEVGQQDVKMVIISLDTIFSKCLYSFRQQVPSALEVFLSVVLQAATLQPDRMCKAMLQQPSDEQTCLDMFCELADLILSKSGKALRLQFDIDCFFDLLQVFSGSLNLKESMGLPLGKTLLAFMGDPTQHEDDYRVHRNCASTLITLLRGSKANKNKLSVYCDTIAEALQTSSDFFFQMQCVEILFRFYAHNKTVLAHANMNDNLRKGIASLPNDATLLLSIQSFLDHYNAEMNATSILPFTVLRIEVDGSEVCSHTTMYFSRLLVVVLLPGGNGDNFTIPFEHIRSVKLSKDHKLGLRLNRIPPKLSLLMKMEEGKDTLHVFFTQSTLQRVRSCSIHQWIADRKRAAPQRVDHAAAPHDSAVPPTGTGEDAATSRPASAPPPVIAERPANTSNPTSSHTSRKISRQREENDLEEIHRAAAMKATRYREEQQEGLRHASGQIHDMLDNMKHLNGKHRDAFETGFREDMAVIRQAEASLKESAASCVQSLNAELEDVQALGALLKGETDKLREKLAKSVGRSEGVEEASLQRLKQLVDSRMREMEQSLQTLMTTCNPLHAVGEHIAQYASAPAAAGPQNTKARRLEYS